MGKFRKSQCVRCGDYFFSAGGRGPNPDRCPPCKKKHDRELGRNRQRTRRGNQSKTSPSSRNSGGGSIGEGTDMISSPRNLVKPQKSIGRVGRGREGATTRPLALTASEPDPFAVAVYWTRANNKSSKVHISPGANPTHTYCGHDAGPNRLVLPLLAIDDLSPTGYVCKACMFLHFSGLGELWRTLRSNTTEKSLERAK